MKKYILRVWFKNQQIATDYYTRFPILLQYWFLIFCYPTRFELANIYIPPQIQTLPQTDQQVTANLIYYLFVIAVIEYLLLIASLIKPYVI